MMLFVYAVLFLLAQPHLLLSSSAQEVANEDHPPAQKRDSYQPSSLAERLDAVQSRHGGWGAMDRNAYRMSFGRKRAAEAHAHVAMMDPNVFRMSFGKRSHAESAESSPLLANVLSSEPMYGRSEASRIQMLGRSLYNDPAAEGYLRNMKRLDSRLYNIGFGRR